MQPPVIETARLILRPVELSDAPAHNKCMKDWEIVRNFAKSFPHPYADDGSEKFINHIKSQDKVVYWAIALKSAPDEMIGSIELRPHAEKGQRAFWLARAHHNNGYVTEAATAVNDYWFDVMGRDTLHMENALGNIASRRIKEKTGAVFLGTRVSEHVDPALGQSEEWLLKKEDWHRFRAQQRSAQKPA